MLTIFDQASLNRKVHHQYYNHITTTSRTHKEQRHPKDCAFYMMVVVESCNQPQMSLANTYGCHATVLLPR